jgi:AraC family transcriptional regulator
MARTCLLDLSVAVVEELERDGACREFSAEAFCDVFQICLPYRGLFVWQVNGDDVVGDANQVVFVRGGEPYRMRGAVPEGYAELIITPDVEMLAELACVGDGRLFEHPLFARRSCRAESCLQSLRARFHQWAKTVTDSETLAAEEAVLLLMRRALHQSAPEVTLTNARTARLVRTTKEFLAANLGGRILLRDVGRAVGASPAYLTDLFRRVEGVSLHDYLTRLRLARALVELPHAPDLTTLALDLGFSSHSHFTYTFRRSFKYTPSEFRGLTRRASAASRPTNRSDKLLLEP